MFKLFKNKDKVQNDSAIGHMSPFQELAEVASDKPSPVFLSTKPG